MQEKRQKPVTIRATDSEHKVLTEFAARIKRKNPYMSLSDVLRALIHLDGTGIVTDEDRQFLRTRFESISSDEIATDDVQRLTKGAG